MKSKVVILGVNHSYQLVSKECQPAAYRAFMERVKPDGIGIERSPESFVRGDYYEFTYEQQNICVPYALKKGIQIHPFDWNLSTEDQLLAWNISNIDDPPLIRQNNHYNDFKYFPTLEEDFFYSERPEIKGKIKNWMEIPTNDQHDFPRRLFLYRTYMQAMRIKKIANQYNGKTLLIIVGHMHKYDIEEILKQEKDIEIIQPSSFGYPEESEIVKNQHVEDFFAIAAFNLLGVQSQYEIDYEWLEEVIGKLNKQDSSIEVELFTLLFNRNHYSNEERINKYNILLQKARDERTFTYTGVVDKTRLDSFFNPFASLSIKSYLQLLIGKEYSKLGNTEKALDCKMELLQNEHLNPKQKGQLEAYWERFILK
ncbi:hypothetical protein A8F94_09480 [Bacillus sp. FJAT-27225]|uniref:hypothetical protein n=1 Tax=Bacillus sp. FJAT-27225 TaxID=1743144 RepID=UPI00080C25BB|nr:hypothetical protein [Bacillus sp. FJAT-27225]OCA88043.1 hypothetical protein A8F94_09480 [Bacillus sp. FJAT-27225]